MNLSEDVDLEEFVMAKDDLSGADIKAVCTEAGLLALRERRMRVTKADFVTARERVSTFAAIFWSILFNVVHLLLGLIQKERGDPRRPVPLNPVPLVYIPLHRAFFYVCSIVIHLPLRILTGLCYIKFQGFFSASPGLLSKLPPAFHDPREDIYN